MNRSSFFLCLFPLQIFLVNSCLLIGNVQGNCVPSVQLSNFVDVCAPYLADYVCVPFNSVYFDNTRSYGKIGLTQLLMITFMTL